MERVTDLVSEKKQDPDSDPLKEAIRRGHLKQIQMYVSNNKKMYVSETTDPDAVVKVLECSNSRVNFCRADCF